MQRGIQRSHRCLLDPGGLGQGLVAKALEGPWDVKKGRLVGFLT